MRHDEEAGMTRLTGRASWGGGCGDKAAAIEGPSSGAKADNAGV